MYFPSDVSSLANRRGRRPLGLGATYVVADLDAGDAEIARLALVGVADRALAVLDRLDDAGRALRRTRRP